MVVLAIPLYNHARHLPEALESLLCQEDSDFRVLLADDHSTDDTWAIAERYARRDARLYLYRNEHRLGYAGNAMGLLRKAWELYPEAEYFAWASDHDVWHPRWIKALHRALDARPEAVLACPRIVRIDERGEVSDTRPRDFETRGVLDSLTRFRAACKGMTAGNMIYGLFRSSALRQTQGLRHVLMPDRLLLAELSLLGEFVQVPEILWYRRYERLMSYDRQRRAIFLDNPLPVLARLPWQIAHAWLLFRHLNHTSPSSFALRVAAVYLRVLAAKGVMNTLGRLRKSFLRGRRDLKARVLDSPVGPLLRRCRNAIRSRLS